MSDFWDQHPDTGAGGYLSPEEKEALVTDKTAFDIVGVSFQAENKFGPRYLVSLALPDQATGENVTRLIGFPKGSGVASRDDALEAMLGYFAEGGEPIPTILAKGGQAFLLKPAP